MSLNQRKSNEGMKHFKRLLLATSLALIYACTQGQKPQSEQMSSGRAMNVVYGDKHIFTIETPEGWLNDKVFAQKIGLVNFFYARKDSLLQQKSYMYANGYDKVPVGQTLEDFINSDIENYRKKYPDFKSEKINVGISGGIKNGQMYSFSNLHDRFKEEVVYLETEETVIVFSFSAMTESHYKQYRSVFDDFLNSFKYRGNNPKPFLDYMNKRKQ